MVRSSYGVSALQMRPGRWISVLSILARVPGLVIMAADRQTVATETRTMLLWISSAALATLVGLAEVYVGMAVVSRRHAGLALLWVLRTYRNQRGAPARSSERCKREDRVGQRFQRQLWCKLMFRHHCKLQPYSNIFRRVENMIPYSQS